MSMGSKQQQKEAPEEELRPLGRGRSCRFCQEGAGKIDYKDIGVLRGFVNERGKMSPRRLTYLCALHQRAAATAIRRARMLALIPYSTTGN